MTGRKKFALQLPQMEYTRFPWAANEPPRADALRGLIEAFGTAITRPTENICSHRSLAYHARILKTFSYLYQVGFVTLLRLLLSVQAFAFRGRLMSLLELTLCGVSSRPFIPQESHACTPSNKCKSRKQLTNVKCFRSTY